MADVGQAPLFEAERTWAVGEVAARLQRAVASAFQREIWVRGEVHGLRSPNASGHVYLSLCERVSRRGPTTNLSVALFRQDRLRLERELAAWPEFRLADGLEVRVRGRVQYSYGRVQLVVSAIDPVHTLGRLAAARERVLAALAKEGLLDANERLPLPVAPLQVGLVASEGSAACRDVLDELAASGFGFRVILADARTQGVGAEASLLRALAALATVRLDVVLVVRGGGARTDLSTFDSERLARAIAAFPAPVLTGIGHEIDTSVADAVAHAALKTPTACARAVCDRVTTALARAGTAWSGAAAKAVMALGRRQDRLEGARQRLREDRLGAHLDRCRVEVDRTAARVAQGAGRALGDAEGALDLWAARAGAADPARALARGWTVTRRPGGGLVRRAADLEAGASVVTTFVDGQVVSTVDEVRS